MPRVGVRFLVTALLLAACLMLAAWPVVAQQPAGTRGFNLTMSAIPEAQELAAQSDLWMMEVSFKPMRMIRVEVTDPKTKQKSTKLVWYLVWRAVNRTIERPSSENDIPQPTNEKDLLPRPFFVPEFTLVTDDNGVQQVYPDTIIPEAQAAIAAREKMTLKNGIEISQPLPDPVAAGEQPKTVLEGVAMWTGVDPKTDYFTVYATGFGSAYRIENGPDGKPVIWRKTIVQEYWRPSDAIDEREAEIRRLDELQPSSKTQHAPRWIYRADDKAAANVQDLPVPDEKPGDEAKPAAQAEQQPAADEAEQPAAADENAK